MKSTLKINGITIASFDNSDKAKSVVSLYMDLDKRHASDLVYVDGKQAVVGYAHHGNKIAYV